MNAITELESALRHIEAVQADADAAWAGALSEPMSPRTFQRLIQVKGAVDRVSDRTRNMQAEMHTYLNAARRELG